jgi:hypothetical protein
MDYDNYPEQTKEEPIWWDFDYQVPTEELPDLFGPYETSSDEYNENNDNDVI